MNSQPSSEYGRAIAGSVNAADREERTTQATSAYRRGETPGIPSFLEKKPEVDADPTTELGLQRKQFEQAVTALTGMLATMPTLLLPVMTAPSRDGEKPLQAADAEPAGTPLGQWLASQTLQINRLAQQTAAMMRRIDL